MFNAPGIQGSLSKKTHNSGAKQHGKDTHSTHRNRTVVRSRIMGTSAGPTARTRARACRLGRSSSSGSGILLALTENITVVVCLGHDAVGELFDGLFLGEAVDAAVVVVFHGAVAFAAGVEDGGHVAR